jgi:hypothetical protein
MTQNKDAQRFEYWDKTMDEQKTRKTDVARKAPVRVQTELWPNVRVLGSKLGEIDGLAIDENFDLEGDPYNSTGQHVILELKKHNSE